MNAVNALISNVSETWAINVDLKKRTVGFLDRRYAGKTAGWKFGQPVATYYIDTILEHKDGCALSLWLDIPSWTVSAEDMTETKKQLKSYRETFLRA